MLLLVASSEHSTVWRSLRPFLFFIAAGGPAVEPLVRKTRGHYERARLTSPMGILGTMQ